MTPCQNGDQRLTARPNVARTPVRSTLLPGVSQTVLMDRPAPPVTHAAALAYVRSGAADPDALEEVPHEAFNADPESGGFAFAEPERFHIVGRDGSYEVRVSGPPDEWPAWIESFWARSQHSNRPLDVDTLGPWQQAAVAAAAAGTGGTRPARELASTAGYRPRPRLCRVRPDPRQAHPRPDQQARRGRRAPGARRRRPAAGAHPRRCLDPFMSALRPAVSRQPPLPAFGLRHLLPEDGRQPGTSRQRIQHLTQRRLRGGVRRPRRKVGRHLPGGHRLRPLLDRWPGVHHRRGQVRGRRRPAVARPSHRRQQWDDRPVKTRTDAAAVDGDRCGKPAV